MNTFWLKLILTPALIGAASLAGRKWGLSVSGWLVALPLTSGPIVFLLALAHGAAFAADSAAGILAGGFSLAAFALTYVRLARRWSWLPTLASATLAFGLMTVLLQYATIPIVPLWAGVVAAFVLVLRLLPQDSDSSAEAEAVAGRWDIPLRMAIATVFVVLITSLAPLLGPRLAGLLAPFPLFTATLAAFAQHQHGPAAAIKLFRGLMLGLFSFASFMFTLSLLLVPAGIPAAFAIAILVVCLFQGTALWLLRRRIG
jgi:hypothetical protein